MGRRRSGGTGTPAMRYLYMSACCSSSAHCAAVKTAAPRGCCWCGYPPTPVAAELSIGAATLLLLAPRSLPKQSEERMQEEDVRWGLVEGSWWRPLSEEEEDEGREGSVVALAAGCGLDLDALLCASAYCYPQPPLYLLVCLYLTVHGRWATLPRA
jgi:hypothetical protein